MRCTSTPAGVRVFTLMMLLRLRIQRLKQLQHTKRLFSVVMHVQVHSPNSLPVRNGRHSYGSLPAAD